MIDVQGLTCTYPGAAGPAVDDVSFGVARGEVFGLLGPSGAGKTTIQKVLIRLLRAYRGAVNIFDRDLTAWGQDYYERIGVSFELPYHYHKLTALENLNYFRALYGSQTDEPRLLLELVGLADDAGRRVGEYSKGMRLRLNLARALLHRPELLFLDEPTAGLDPGTSRRIRQLIRDRQATGTTIFLTTHDMSVANELCDRVAFIAAGRLLLIDSPRALRLRYGQRTVLVELERDGTTEQRAFPLDDIAGNVAFLETLQDPSLQTIHTQETTLEDVFLRVTGTSLT